MRRRKILTFNLLAPVTIAIAIYLGWSGLVSWYTIGLIALSHCSIDFTWRR